MNNKIITIDLLICVALLHTEYLLIAPHEFPDTARYPWDLLNLIKVSIIHSNFLKIYHTKFNLAGITQEYMVKFPDILLKIGT